MYSKSPTNKFMKCQFFHIFSLKMVEAGGVEPPSTAAQNRVIHRLSQFTITNQQRQAAVKRCLLPCCTELFNFYNLSVVLSFLVRWLGRPPDQAAKACSKCKLLFAVIAVELLRLYLTYLHSSSEFYPVETIAPPLFTATFAPTRCVAATAFTFFHN